MASQLPSFPRRHVDALHRLIAKCSRPISMLAFATFAIDATAAGSHRKIQVFITPECKDEFYGSPEVKRARPDYVAWDPAHVKSFTFKDPRSQVTFYVESDGRHLAAIASSGELLWVRNPFEEAGLCPYRSPHPVIYSLHNLEHLPDYGSALAPYLRKLGMNPGHTFVQIEFDSSQFGILDEASGNFLVLGQN